MLSKRSVRVRKIALAANNYAWGLRKLRRFKEAKALMRKMMPVARRVLGETHELMLKMRLGYAMALYMDTGATLDDLREAVETLEDAVRIARRVFGGAHPTVTGIEMCLRNARIVLRARDPRRHTVSSRARARRA